MLCLASLHYLLRMNNHTVNPEFASRGVKFMVTLVPSSRILNKFLGRFSHPNFKGRVIKKT